MLLIILFPDMGGHKKSGHVGGSYRACKESWAAMGYGNKQVNVIYNLYGFQDELYNKKVRSGR